MSSNQLRRTLWLAPTLVGVFLYVLLTARSIESRYNPYEAPGLPPVDAAVLADRPENCVPLPQPQSNEVERTPTPERGNGEPYQANPTSTPYPTTRVIDLSPEIPNQEKSVIYVFRCNGDYEKILAGPGVSIFETIELFPGDVILRAFQPNKFMGGNPNEPTQSYPGPVQTQEPTLPSYPSP